MSFVFSLSNGGEHVSNFLHFVPSSPRNSNCTVKLYVMSSWKVQVGHIAVKKS